MAATGAGDEGDLAREAAAAADRARGDRMRTAVWWGKRLAAVRVDPTRADEELLAGLLKDGWEGKAPARLVRAEDAGASP
jgi:hypothetical protein